MSIATKTGDKGTTALLFNRRVSKSDLRIECNGMVDELNAALGLARALLRGSKGDPSVTGRIVGIQKELVDLMGQIAVDIEDRQRYSQAGFTAVSSARVDALTAIIDDLEKNHKISFHGWATPGDSLPGAALDVARTVCRRAERSVVALFESDATLNPEIVRYLNRLSDLCWLWARWMETGETDLSADQSS
jgi:cob(I)alamin adenosyltransferase